MAGNIFSYQGTLKNIPKDIANIIVKAIQKIIAIEINSLNKNVCSILYTP